MVATILMVTGALCWSVFAVGLAGDVRKRKRVRRWFERPALYPYTLFVRSRAQGFFVRLLGRLGSAGAKAIPTEVVHAFRTASVEDFKHLRAVLHEVDELPTVRRGLEALGIKSIFEVPYRSQRAHDLAMQAIARATAAGTPRPMTATA